MNGTKKETTGGKILKVIAAIFLSLAILILVGLFIVDLFFTEQIKRTITTGVKQGTDGLYELEIGDLGINPLTFKVRLRDVHLTTDEGMYQEKLGTQDASPYLDLKVDELSIRQFNVWGFLFSDRMQIRAVEVQNPIATVRLPETDEEFNILELYKDLEGVAEPLIVNNIEIAHLHLDLEMQEGEEWHQIRIGDGSLLVNDLRVDSAAAYDEDMFLYTERMRLTIADSAVFNLVGLYKGSLSSVEADTEEGLSIRDILVLTDKELYARNKAQGSEDAFIEARIPEIRLAYEDWGKILIGGEMHVSALHIDRPNIYFLASQTQAGNNNDTLASSPQDEPVQIAFHEQINEMYPSLTFDSVRISQAFIHAVMPDAEADLDIRIPHLDVYLGMIRIDSTGANDLERFLYAQDASIVTREGISVKQGQQLDMQADRFVLSTDSGIFANNISLKGDMLENMSATLAALRIEFTQWGRLQQGDTTHIDRIALVNPVFRGDLPAGSGNGNANNSPAPQQRGFALDLHENLSAMVPLLTIGAVEITDIDVQTTLAGDAPTSVEVSDLDLLLTDLRIDEIGARDPNRFMYASAASILSEEGIRLKQGNDLSLVTERVLMATDSGIFVNGLTFSGNDPNMNLTTRAIRVRFTQWGNLQQGKATTIDLVELDRPVFRGTIAGNGNGGGSNGNGQRGFALDLHKDLNEMVESLAIGTVAISNADIRGAMTSNGDRMHFNLPDLNLVVNDMRLDEQAAFDRNRFMYAANASLSSTQGVAVNMPGQLAFSTGELIFSTDSGLFVSDLKYQGSASPDIDASVRGLNLWFTQWGRLQHGDAIHIAGLGINDPVVKAVMPAAPEGNGEDIYEAEEEEVEPDLKAIPAQISEFVAGLSIGNFRLRNANIRMETPMEEVDVPSFYHGRGLNISMDNIRIDSAAADDPNRFLFASVFELDLERADMRPDRFYDMGLQNLHLNKGQKTLSLRNFSMQPRYPKTEFGDIAGEETQRLVMHIPSVQISGLDYPQLTEMNIIADLIKVRGLDVEMFLDRHLPPVEPEPPFFPHTMLRELPMIVNINRVEVTEGHFVYEELAEGGHESGAFTFENMSANITDLVNRPVKGYDNTNVQVNFDLMGAGTFIGKLEFPVMDPENNFSFSGYMSPLNLEKLNPALEYIAFTRIEEGQMHSLSFKGQGNREIIRGEMLASYEDLSIELLEEGPEEPGFPTTVISSFANRLLHNDNVKGTDDFYPGDMELERDEDLNFFGFLIQAVNRGLFDSFGVADLLDFVESVQARIPFAGEDE